MKLAIGIAVVALLIAGFAWVRSISQQPIAGGGLPVTGIEWRPAMIGGLPVIEADTMHVRFEVDGEIAGHGGCNRFFGSLQQSDAGIEVGMLGSTRMACAEPVMDREQAFLDAIQKTRGFRQREDRLDLVDADGNVLAELVRGG